MCCGLAKEHRPKLIVCGGSAYPRTVEASPSARSPTKWARSSSATWPTSRDSSRPGLHPNPVEHCDFVTSTTHKTLAGPRSGFVLCRRSTRRPFDRAVFPGMQGGPLNHVSAAKATCLRIAGSDAYRENQGQVRAKREERGRTRRALQAGGLDVLTGGTDTHLLLVDLRRTDWTGKDAEERLAEVGDHRQSQHRSVRRASADRRLGLPRGTPAMTMRGFDEDDFREVGAIIVDAWRGRGSRRALRAERGAPRTPPAYPGPRLPHLFDWEGHGQEPTSSRHGT